MASRYQHKRKTVAGHIPVAADVLPGEMVLNTADGTIWTKNEADELVQILPTQLTALRLFRVYTDCIASVNTNEWTHTVSGTGAAFSVLAVGAENAIGILRFAGGTVATGRGSIASPNFTSLLFGKGIARFSSTIRQPVLSDITNTYTIRAGFIQSITAESTNGAFFRYTNGVNSGRWQAVTRTNNAETAVDTGIAATANTWIALEIEVNAAGTSALFKINGAVVATITTNIPVAAGREFGYGVSCIKALGTVAVNMMDCDYVEMVMNFTTAR
jgi:hypothetical protein